ncbi:MAG TPA: methionyl-tRNA formyltransferase [Planctomycetaceae bacterium]|nr:methionyl-tRNA formyltransferase [Planctomycetaceae bacterium]
MSLRIIFLGTGRLAQPVFEALCASPHAVVGLVTQPDRTGPGHHRHQNPLKELAAARAIPVLQPVRIKTAESVAALRALNADLFVVAAYGQILSREILDMPRLGTINVHASLLPKHRGATPIHAAILHGDVETGITIIRLVPELDAGPMLGVVRTPIAADETTGALEARLAEMAPVITLEVIAGLEAGTVRPLEQDHAQATHVGKLDKAAGRIPWAKSAIEVERHIRGMQPWPGPFTLLHQPDKPPLRMQVLHGVPMDSRDPAAPGTITAVDASQFTIRCGDGGLRITQVHPDGKRPMPTGDFLRGRPVHIGDRCE